MTSIRRWLALDSTVWVLPLIVATLLAASMAWSSTFNVHPDELHHARAADYYRNHWLPPQFGAADAIPSYSNYGSSYLHERDIVYLLAGKWSIVVGPIVGDVDLSYRLFNLALLAAFVIAFVRTPATRLLLVPLILSAQVWYVFSYFNADAFALAVALFIACQVTVHTSLFNSALDSNSHLRWFGGVLLLGIGFGMALLSKRNYYIFLIFLIAYVALKEIGFRASIGVALGTSIGIGWYYRIPIDLPWWVYACAALPAAGLVVFDVRPHLSSLVFRRRVGTYIAAGVIGLALFLPRVAYDKFVVENPANRYTSIAAAAEVFAADGYKPSQIAAGKSNWNLHLREKGMPYLVMLGDGRWGRDWLWISFRSTVGVYGYMKIYSSDGFYVLVGMTYAALILLLGFEAWRSRCTSSRHSYAVAAIYIILTVLISSFHSWVSDFQAQGRYLFAGFVMFGMVLKDVRGQLPTVVSVTIGTAFLLGVYSFVDTGLRLIPKG